MENHDFYKLLHKMPTLATLPNGTLGIEIVDDWKAMWKSDSRLDKYILPILSDLRFGLQNNGLNTRHNTFDVGRLVASNAIDQVHEHLDVFLFRGILAFNGEASVHDRLDPGIAVADVQRLIERGQRHDVVRGGLRYDQLILARRPVLAANSVSTTIPRFEPCDP
ncbi:hypothetical protein PsorP6_001181 [Peronosclerospora sorghi]|uniref:Uncharacterized protein n=1 Tax=Peronosclerospora sorghi TaxID=230839 RepID=A0ACC0WSL5_9STRA|nr:hypothetical protein PsorP6_001181 [Peronosclerospora sorghi]